ncbi:GH25 family lysozyme [Actinophytocola xanthii]|uniref:Lysozyme n=1 Tax=Actinophytocola xanthii TaxID=1912961 RepID=A0A1Q8CLG1_9PSEU|nr:GH25 family lysozyme [Actinophytocola xanthii]OLF15202.1 hypothetical protein BU204_23360 [Actinophytocola xanthii]
MLVVGAVPVTAAAADEGPIVVNGVVRDNVDNTHSPQLDAAQEQERARGSAEEAPRAATPHVRGIDVASHQHPKGAAINWRGVAGAGYRFAAVKASEGNYYTNPYYTGDRSSARTAGMYTYAYHFAIPNVSSGRTQAGYFVDRVGYQQDGRTLPPALDIEWNPYADRDGTNACYGLSKSQMVAWIRDFLAEVRRRTGVQPIIYTAAYWWRDCTGGTSAFSGNPLWVASYAAKPRMPSGWPTYAIWQHTSSATVPGISALTDGNIVRGGENTLRALAVRSSASAGYTAVDPVRVLDTRNAVGVGSRTPLGAGGTVLLDLSRRLPRTATAAVLNVTGMTSRAGYLTVWPNGTPRPPVSNLNLAAGETRPNLVTVQLTGERKLRLFSSASGTHVLADLAGWYATDATPLFTAHTPRRVLDTRRTGGAVGPGASRRVDLSSVVPTGATAVTLTVTGVGAARPTFVTAWPTGRPRPRVSTLNLADGRATPNLVTVRLGAGRSVNLYNHAGSVHLLVDVAGYYRPGSGARFVATTPRRLIDTRGGRPTWVPASGGGQALALNTLGQAAFGVTGTVLNLTGVSPSTGTFMTVYARTSATPARPRSSNLNLVTRQTASTLVSTAVGPGSTVWVYSNAGTVHLIADVAGYFVSRR